jgi:O-acetyl-ADP-ribose deacetylase (regulator of RNase III)
MKPQITYKNGDATAPISSKNKIIVHICNDIGGWGRGFVLAVSKRWAAPEKKYKEWFASKEGFGLGEVLFVQVEPDIWVANLIGQHTIYKDKDGNPPIRYEAVLAGLEKVAQFALENDATLHLPRIGCGLAGGTWDKIEPLIEATLLEKELEVTVYDF